MIFRLHVRTADVFIRSLEVDSRCLDHFRKVQLQIVVSNVNDVMLALARDVMSRAKSLGISSYPAFYLGGGLITDYTSVAFWEKKAAALRQVLMLRDVDDARIGIDMENYAGPEPSLVTLEKAGYEPNDLIVSMDPFLDVLEENMPVEPHVYPANAQGGLDVLCVLQAFPGEAWTEHTFNMSEKFFTSHRVEFQDTLAATVKHHAALRSIMPNSKIRPVSNDQLLRSWGAIQLRDGHMLGENGVWIFDQFRKDISVIGSYEWITGTSLSSVNDITHSWRFQPRFTYMPATYDMGVDKKSVDQVAGNANTLVVIPTQEEDMHGIKLQKPSSFTWAGLRVLDALPADKDAPWSLDFEFKLPRGLKQNYPIMCLGQSNVGVWQLAYVYDSNEIVLQVRGNRVTHRLTVIKNPVIGEFIKVQLGRSGETWYCCGAISTIPGVSTTRPILLGAGHYVDTFPLNASLVMCEGLTLGSLTIWHRLLTNEEFVIVSKGNFPWGLS